MSCCQGPTSIVASIGPGSEKAGASAGMSHMGAEFNRFRNGIDLSECRFNSEPNGRGARKRL